MSVKAFSAPLLDETEIVAVAETLAERGWVVLEDFMPLELVRELRDQAQQQQAAGGFHAAAIGRGQAQNVNSAVRGDQVQWLETAQQGALAAYQTALENLRQQLNSLLYLGLFEFEAHFAVYAPGTFYQNHLDNFRGTSARIISAVLYLNEDWQASDGGQLRLYTDGTQQGAPVDILPQAGQLVLFRSEDFWHEVLPAQRERFSVTGWLRLRCDVV